MTEMDLQMPEVHTAWFMLWLLHMQVGSRAPGIMQVLVPWFPSSANGGSLPPSQGHCKLHLASPLAGAEMKDELSRKGLGRDHAPDEAPCWQPVAAVFKMASSYLSVMLMLLCGLLTLSHGWYV